MIKYLSYPDALGLLERAVGEKGKDYEYPLKGAERCIYFTQEGQPSCIIGHVFNYLGIGDGVEEGSGVREVLAELGIDVDRGTMTLLEWAQIEQDDSQAWGDALETAKYHAGREMSREYS